MRWQDRQDTTAFNAYLETVSAFLQLGRPEARLAMYLPVEDNWIADRIPAEERTPAAVYRWELRHVEVPPETQGYAPLWISTPFLQKAVFQGGLLRVGELTVAGLYVDVAWLDAEALAHILTLARTGLPVVLKRQPQQPGRAQRPDYAAQLEELTGLPNVHASLREAGLKPLLEGEDLPPFWVRGTERFLYVFFAPPAARSVRYPLRYGQAAEAGPAQRRVTVDTGAARVDLDLQFASQQALAVRIARTDGRAEWINITFVPPRPLSLPTEA